MTLADISALVPTLISDGLPMPGSIHITPDVFTGKHRFEFSPIQLHMHGGGAGDVARWAAAKQVGLSVHESFHGVQVAANFEFEGIPVQAFASVRASDIAETLSRHGFGLDLTDPVEVDPEIFLAGA